MTPDHRALIERIRSSAAVLRRAVETAPPARFDVAPRAGEWSALETLTHLRDVIVFVYGLRMRRLFYENAPVFVDFDEEGYRGASLARGETKGALLDTVVAEHEQLARLSRDPGGRGLGPRGAPSGVRRHVHRVPRPARGRARRGARGADRGRGAGPLSRE